MPSASNPSGEQDKTPKRSTRSANAKNTPTLQDENVNDKNAKKAGDDESVELLDPPDIKSSETKSCKLAGFRDVQALTSKDTVSLTTTSS